MIDLHTHSTASDGTYTPAQLMEYAHSRNINAIALTDHDSIDGIIEAQKKARELSMEFIPAHGRIPPAWSWTPVALKGTAWRD